jgi:hypothetical protein
MPRSQGTTTQRGLGYKHQADKRRLLRELRPGQPCPRCGAPMWPHQALDRGHTTERTFGGVNSPGRLEHASCNRSAGAALSTPLRLARQRTLLRTQRVTASRDW